MIQEDPAENSPLSALQNALQTYYAEQKNLRIPGENKRDFLISQCYVQLTLLQAAPPDTPAVSLGEPLRESSLQAEESHLNKKVSLSLEALLSPLTEEAPSPRTVLVEGRAGIGKTTLCHYLAHRWATERAQPGSLFQQFDWVFWLPLRSVTNYLNASASGAQRSIAEWLHTQLPEPLRYDPSFGIHTIKDVLYTASRSARCALLLDGWDEIATLYAQEGEAKGLLEGISQHIAQYTNATVLVTSRPYAVNLPLRFDRTVENIGFTDVSARAFMERYFQAVPTSPTHTAEQKMDRLWQQRQQHPILRRLSYLPLMLYLLCDTHNQSPENPVLAASSLSPLYRKLMESLLRRRDTSGHTADQLLQAYDAELTVLKAVALQLSLPQEGTAHHDDLTVTRTQLEETIRAKGSPASLTRLLKTGVLYALSDSNQQCQLYRFFHKTFQEYLTAEALVDALAPTQKGTPAFNYALDCLCRRKYQPAFDVILQCVLELTAEAGDVKRTQYVLDALLTTHLDWVGLAQQKLHLRILDTFCLPRDSTKDVLADRRTALQADLFHWLDRACFLSRETLAPEALFPLRALLLDYPTLAKAYVAHLSALHERGTLTGPAYARAMAIYYLPLLPVAPAQGERIVDYLASQIAEEQVRAIDALPWSILSSAPIEQKQPFLTWLETGLDSATTEDNASLQIACLMALSALCHCTQELSKTGRTRLGALAQAWQTPSACETPAEWVGYHAQITRQHLQGAGSEAGQTVPAEIEALWAPLTAALTADDKEHNAAHNAAGLRASQHWLQTQSTLSDLQRSLLHKLVPYCCQQHIGRPITGVLTPLQPLLAPEQQSALQQARAYWANPGQKGAEAHTSPQTFFLSPEEQTALLASLQKRLSRAEVALRLEVIRGLGRVGEGDTKTLQCILEALPDAPERMQKAIFSTLLQWRAIRPDQVGPLFEVLLPLLSASPSWIQAAASKILEAAASQASSAQVRQLIEMLLPPLQKGDYANAHIAAAKVWPALASRVDTADVPALMKTLLPHLHDGNAYVRATAIKACFALAARVDTADVPALMKTLLPHLQDRNTCACTAAAEALLALAARVDTADIPALMKTLLPHLQDGNTCACTAAAEAWSALAARVDTADVPALMKTLLPHLQNTYACTAAAGAWSALAARVDTADVPALMKTLLPHLQDGNTCAFTAAAEALLALAARVDAADVPVLIEKLLPLLKDGRSDKDRKADVRTAAIQAWSALAARVDTADVPQLMKTLLPHLQETEDAYVRTAAIQAWSALAARVDTADVPALMKTFSPLFLKDSYDDAHTAAIQAWSALAARVDTADVPQLMKTLLPLLKDSYENVRTAAIQAWSALAARVDTADVPALMKTLSPLFLKDSYDDARTAAIQAWSALAARVDTADVPALMKTFSPLFLKDSYDDARTAAIQAWSALAARVDTADVPQLMKTLLPLLKDSYENVRTAAIQAWSALVSRVDAVDVLVLINMKTLLPLLKDSYENVRTAAIQAWSALASRVNTADVPALMKTLLPGLQHWDSNVHTAVIQAGSALAARVDTADVPQLIKTLLPYLQHWDRNVRTAAIQAWSALASHVDTADVPALMKTLLPLLKDSYENVRTAAIQAWSALAARVDTADVPQFMKTLLPHLQDGNAYACTAAAEALLALAARVNAADVPVLIEKLLPLLKDGRSDKDRKADVRTAAIKAWSALVARVDTADVPALMKTLLPHLQDGNAYACTAAAEALLALAARVDTVDVPALIEKLLPLLKDRRVDVRTAAAEALLALASHADVAQHVQLMKVLLPRLKDDEDPNVRTAAVRTAAAEALLALASRVDAADAAQFMKTLLPLLQDENADVRTAAIQALGGMASKVSSTQVGALLVTLLPCFQEEHPPVQQVIAKIFSSLDAVVAAALSSSSSSSSSSSLENSSTAGLTAQQACETVGTWVFYQLESPVAFPLLAAALAPSLPALLHSHIDTITSESPHDASRLASAAYVIIGSLFLAEQAPAGEQALSLPIPAQQATALQNLANTTHNPPVLRAVLGLLHCPGVLLETAQPTPDRLIQTLRDLRQAGAPPVQHQESIWSHCKQQYKNYPTQFVQTLIQVEQQAADLLPVLSVLLQTLSIPMDMLLQGYLNFLSEPLQTQQAPPPLPFTIAWDPDPCVSRLLKTHSALWIDGSELWCWCGVTARLVEVKQSLPVTSPAAAARQAVLTRLLQGIQQALQRLDVPCVPATVLLSPHQLPVTARQRSSYSFFKTPPFAEGYVPLWSANHCHATGGTSALRPKLDTLSFVRETALIAGDYTLAVCQAHRALRIRLTDEKFGGLQVVYKNNQPKPASGQALYYLQYDSKQPPLERWSFAWINSEGVSESIDIEKGTILYRLLYTTPKCSSCSVENSENKKQAEKPRTPGEIDRISLQAYARAHYRRTQLAHALEHAVVPTPWHYLDLSNNELNDESLCIVEQWLRMPNIPQPSILRLSQNALTEQGLKYVLAALAEKGAQAEQPSVHYLLLDYNEIALSAPYCQELVAPEGILAKTRLVHVDVSMNVTAPGKRKVYQEDPRQNLYLASEETLEASGISKADQCYVHHQLHHNACLHSEPDERVVESWIKTWLSPSSDSKPPPEHELKGHVCIALLAYPVKEGGHTFLCMERFYTDIGQREFILTDLTYQKEAGVQICIRSIHPDELRKKIKKTNPEYREYTFLKRETFDTLLENLYNSRAHQSMLEYALLPNKEDIGRYNCVKWATEQLKRVGVTIEVRSLPIPTRIPTCRVM